MKKKIGLVSNIASYYRKSIYSLIDREYDCDFFFSKKYNDIKIMDYSVLRGKVTEVRTLRIGNLSYQVGILSLLFKSYKTYVAIGDTRSLSTWFFLLLSKLFPRKEVYVWTHGWYGKETKMEIMLKKLFLRLPSGVILYGNYARDLMIKEGFNPNKLFVIHNSLNYQKQLALRRSLHQSRIFTDHFGNGCDNIIFIGRLTEIKRLDLLIDSIYLLKKHGKIYNLTLIGDGEMEKELKERVSLRGMWGNVWFYGACYDEDSAGLLLFNADVCVSPGNVGLTAIHSLMFGTPVITHDNFSSQMPEFEAVIRGKTGDFFQHNNIESLALCIDHWLSCSARRRKEIQYECFNEIDKRWTPEYQIEIIKNIIR